MGVALLQGLLKFFNEETFAADFIQSSIQDLVTACRHSENGNVTAWVETAQTALDVMGLPQGKFAFAGGDDDAAGVSGLHETIDEEIVEILSRDCGPESQ